MIKVPKILIRYQADGCPWLSWVEQRRRYCIDMILLNAPSVRIIPSI